MSGDRPHVLFVCTGNTCRSPLAEAIARDLWGDRANVRSAGTIPEDGAQASPNAIRVADELGLDLTDFRSSSLDDAVEPDFVLAMESFHVDAARDRFPSLPSNAIRLLDPAEIMDPIREPIDAYRQVAVQITRAIAALDPRDLG